jgi:hypothetical protein
MTEYSDFEKNPTGNIYRYLTVASPQEVAQVGGERFASLPSPDRYEVHSWLLLLLQYQMEPEGFGLVPSETTLRAVVDLAKAYLSVGASEVDETAFLRANLDFHGAATSGLCPNRPLDVSREAEGVLTELRKNRLEIYRRLATAQIADAPLPNGGGCRGERAEIAPAVRPVFGQFAWLVRAAGHGDLVDKLSDPTQRREGTFELIQETLVACEWGDDGMPGWPPANTSRTGSIGFDADAPWPLRDSEVVQKHGKPEVQPLVDPRQARLVWISAICLALIGVLFTFMFVGRVPERWGLPLAGVIAGIGSFMWFRTLQSRPAGYGQSGVGPGVGV